MELVDGKQLRQANSRYSGGFVEGCHALSAENDQAGILQEVDFELNGGVDLEVGLAREDIRANVVYLEVESGQEALLPELRNYLALLVAAFELVERAEGELLRF